MTFPFPFFIKQRTFATFDPSAKGTNTTLSGGNLTAAFANGFNQHTRITQGKSVGKWYAEITVTTVGSTAAFGICDSGSTLDSQIYGSTHGSAYVNSDGHIYANSVTDEGAYGNTWTSGDKLMIALDMDNHKVFYGKNGTWQNSGDPAAGTGGAQQTGYTITGTILPAFQGNNTTVTGNFGASAFTYTPPNGFNYGFYT